MDNGNARLPHSPRLLSKSFYDRAKRLWGLAIVLKVSAVGLGVIFVTYNVATELAPWSLAVLAIVAESIQWRSDVLRGRAEQLKRKIELSDGLGWPLPMSDFSDLLAKVSKRTLSNLEASSEQEYFASAKEAGPVRALENLQESAWWSKHLSHAMLVGCAIVAAVLIGGSIAILVLTIDAAQNVASLENTSKLVSAVISLAVSLGLTQLIAGYYVFSQSSTDSERAATAATASKELPTEVDALKLMYDYQLARAFAPMIPDWLWNLRRTELNALWKSYRGK
jgi:hypothetical protein